MDQKGDFSYRKSVAKNSFMRIC